MVAALLDVHRRSAPPCSRCTTTTFLIDGVPFERFVGHLLERHDLAAAPAAVGGDEQRCTARR